MSTKDFIIIGALIVIIFIIIKMMKSSKEQSGMLTAVAIKTGAIKMIDQKASKSKSNNGEIEEGKEDDSKSPKKVRLNKIQKQVVSLFEDGIPKTIGHLRKSFEKQYSDIDKVKFNNLLYNLKPSLVLNAEKIENTNYWGLGDWFDEDGSFYEEYVEKIPTSNALTVINE